MTSKEAAIIAARLENTSNKKAAKALGIPRRTVDRVVNRVIDRAEAMGVLPTTVQPKILMLDIETAPILSYLWNLWPKGGVNHQMVERPSYILSWAAKWLGNENVMWDALCYDPDYIPGAEDDTSMLAGIWSLIDEADFVVGHNVDKFDLRKLNTRFLLAGFNPPSPYRTIDTLKVVQRTFAFDSNRLDHLLARLFGRGKEDVGGFETWRQCMRGDHDAWERMIHYNKQDVMDVEELYVSIRAWDRSHPSVLTTGPMSEVPACPVCASENMIETNDTVSTNVSRFAVLRCGDCGATSRGRHSLITPQQRDTLLVKAR